MRRTSSVTLELPDDTIVMLSFHLLFTRKPTPACPLFDLEWCSFLQDNQCILYIHSSIIRNTCMPSDHAAPY